MVERTVARTVERKLKLLVGGFVGMRKLDWGELFWDSPSLSAARWL